MGIESARLTDLVSQIIDLSRLQADNPLTTPSWSRSTRYSATPSTAAGWTPNRHDVTLTIAGARGRHVLGNARQLSIAVGNLVENAVVYSDPDTRVVVAAHVQVRSDDDYVEITVSDNGIGIPEREQARIFERFYRVDYARSRANGGTGLGLAIVKHIAASTAARCRSGASSGRVPRSPSVPAHLHHPPSVGSGAAVRGPPGPRNAGRRAGPRRCPRRARRSSHSQRQEIRR